ncbi:S8 family serine peptidase [bacterium]|nr:S8 family serine peptidase [bacterium]
MPRRPAVAALAVALLALPFALPAHAIRPPVTNVPALELLAERLEQDLQARRTPLYHTLLHATDPGAAALNANPDVELAFIGPRNKPFYLTIDNEDAAATVSTDKVWPGGGFGFSLEGANTNLGHLGVWDGGAVRTTHQEFGGRAVQADSPGSTSSHSTHVAGTLIAAGVAAGAQGMSPEAELECYDWNSDSAEMAAAAAGGMWLSSHSYGYVTGWYFNGADDYWYGDMDISTVADYGFGFYSSLSQDWDQVAYNAPDYLICKSAGNDRNDTGSGGHYHYDGGWVWSTDSHPPDGGTLGYDSISWVGVTKNILTVGAVDDIPGGYAAPGDVGMSSFSGWGPTDDGRIKPDVVANGIGLYSCNNTSNTDYTTKSGTSMSTPSAAGSANLLVDFYRQTHGSVTPRSATTKGLLIHTADEAGDDPGPDYAFGWGLVNTLSAAQLIDDDANDPGSITEAVLGNGSTDTYYFTQPSAGPARLTICWTDPAGSPPNDSLDPPDLMLVNDLDLRLTHTVSATVYRPWVLDPANPADAATTGDNFRDNVEQVFAASLPAGDYAVTVTHKGNIGGGQAYSLLASSPLTTTPPATAVAELPAGPGAAVRQIVHPNPFATSTSVSFRLPARSRVSVEVFDVLGRHVRTLADADLEAGTHRMDWDGRDEAGRALSSGIYFTQLTVNGVPGTEKMILVRGR